MPDQCPNSGNTSTATKLNRKMVDSENAVSWASDRTTGVMAAIFRATANRRSGPDQHAETERYLEPAPDQQRADERRRNGQHGDLKRGQPRMPNPRQPQAKAEQHNRRLQLLPASKRFPGQRRLPTRTPATMPKIALPINGNRLPSQAAGEASPTTRCSRWPAATSSSPTVSSLARIARKSISSTGKSALITLAR